MRMKTRSKTPARKRRAPMRETLARVARTMSSRTMFVAVFGALSVAALIGAAASFDDRPGARASHAAAQNSPAAPASPASTALTAVSLPAAAAVSLPHAADAEPAAQERQRSAPVTITGCLERDADRFRLRDAAGENAPRARSWKSGFLKKGPASIHVMDTANKTQLRSHVGQRVSVTGTLVDREMQVRSLQRVAASCGARS